MQCKFFWSQGCDGICPLFHRLSGVKERARSSRGARRFGGNIVASKKRLEERWSVRSLQIKRIGHYKETSMTVIESSKKFLKRMKGSNGNDLGVALGDGFNSKRRDLRRGRIECKLYRPGEVAGLVSQAIVREPMVAIETQANVQISTVITALN